MDKFFRTAMDILGDVALIIGGSYLAYIGGFNVCRAVKKMNFKLIK